MYSRSKFSIQTSFLTFGQHKDSELEAEIKGPGVELSANGILFRPGITFFTGIEKSGKKSHAEF